MKTPEELAAQSAEMDLEDWQRALAVADAPREIRDLVADGVTDRGKYAVVREDVGFSCWDSTSGWAKTHHAEGVRECLSDDARDALDMTLSTWDLGNALLSAPL